jgi:hypothetical protein
MPGSKPGERRGGRRKGTPNKVRTGEELRELAEKAEAKVRIKLAKGGVDLPAIAQQSSYVAQIKPGQRDLTDRFARIQCAIEDLYCLDQIKCERAVHPDMQDVPGGRTGMVVFTYSRRADGMYAKVSRFDSALQSARETLYRYIGTELGQFSPRMEVALRKDGTVGEKPPVNYNCLTDEELEALNKIARKLEEDRMKRSNIGVPQAQEKQEDAKDEWG